MASNEPAAVDRPVSIEDQLDRLGVQAMLLNQDPGGQRVACVVVEDRHRRLDHDWTGVELTGHEVYRRARDADSMGPRLSLSVDAWKRGEQRGVDVEDAVRKRVQEGLAQEPHEAGKA